MHSILIYAVILLGLVLIWLSTRSRYRGSWFGSIGIGFACGGILSAFPELNQHPWSLPTLSVLLGIAVLPIAIQVVEKLISKHA